MAASSDDQQPGGGRSIREAYQNCLIARRQWMSVRGRTSRGDAREDAHADLHETTLAWFETLVPYIAERPGEVKQLWESAPLYPIQKQTVDVLGCEDCGFFVRLDSDDAEERAVGDPCPTQACPTGALGEFQIVDQDDEGNELFEWACGLKRLSSWTNRTETVQVDSGQWETDSNTVERPKRLDPSVLMRAARYLDLAAEEAGLLEESDRALPTGEL